MNKRRGINHPPVSMKAAVFERDGGLCVYRINPNCTGRAETTDHRAGRGSGGSRVLNHGGNLASICRYCNDAKERAVGEAREQLVRLGHLIERAATNAQSLARSLATPMRYPDGRWYRLVDEHTRELMGEVTDALVQGR